MTARDNLEDFAGGDLPAVRFVGIGEGDGGDHEVGDLPRVGGIGLGEVALGMNNGIEKVLKHPLFVEKVGGTLHIAIGASYKDCYVDDPGSDEGRARIEKLEADGVLNRSAQHVDIVTDFRDGGVGRSVRIDGVRIASREGVWEVVG